MGRKDILEKVLFDYNEVFADVYNTLLFEKPFLDCNLLKSGPTESIYKTEKGDYVSQIRDVVKSYKDQHLTIKTLGIENQAGIDRRMPVRVLSYDAASYKIQKPGEETAVITIVLNFSNQRWLAPKSLHELLNLSEDMKPFVSDYQIRVFDIAFLEDEVINSFTSVFKLVAAYFKTKRVNPEDLRKYSDETVEHVEAVCHLLSVFTGDPKIFEMCRDDLVAGHKKGEPTKMCEVVDYFKAEGRQEAEAKNRDNVVSLIKNGEMSVELGAKVLLLSTEDVKKLLEN